MGNRERLAALAGAILLTGALPVAIDQGYFRYNAYLLPGLGLLALVLYLAFLITTKRAQELLRSVYFKGGRKHPVIGLVLFVGVGAIFGGLIGLAGWFTIAKSQEHVNELRRKDVPVRETTAPKEMAPPQAKPSGEAVTPSGSLEGLRVPGAGSPNSRQIVFTTNGTPERSISLGVRPKRILVEPPGVTVSDSDIPKELNTARGQLLIMRFTKDGIVLDERRAAGIEMRVTVIDGEVPPSKPPAPTPTAPGERGMPQPPSNPDKPDKPSPPTGSQTINAPGGINIFGGTVNNPTIHNYPAARPWALDAQQSDLLTRRLAPYAPGRTEHNLITAVMGDPDSARFAWSLVSAFRAAKWSGVSGSGYGQAIFRGRVEGIIVQIHSREATPSGLEEFVGTLQEAGFQVRGEVVPTVPTDEFRIIVGHRP